MVEVVVEIAAKLRQRLNAASRVVCWVCGLRELATIHGDDNWWQHEYEPAILTRIK